MRSDGGLCAAVFADGAYLNILGIKNAYAATTDNAITLRAVDLGGNQIPGLFVAIRDATFREVASGFSVFTASGLTAGTYCVAVYNNYADPAGFTFTFLSANSPDHPTLIPGPFTVTSYGGFGSVTIPAEGLHIVLQLMAHIQITPPSPLMAPVRLFP